MLKSKILTASSSHLSLINLICPDSLDNKISVLKLLKLLLYDFQTCKSTSMLWESCWKDNFNNGGFVEFSHLTSELCLFETCLCRCVHLSWRNGNGGFKVLTCILKLHIMRQQYFYLISFISFYFLVLLSFVWLMC